MAGLLAYYLVTFCELCDILCCAFSGINSTVVSAAPPANALTLDEIHAREDIHPSPTQTTKDTASVGEGMEAFNKLLAVLESKQPVSHSMPTSFSLDKSS